MLNYAVTLAKKKALMYHNLVEEKTGFVTWVKPIIGTLTLVDFGVLTSVAEQEEILKQFRSSKIEKLLSCSYRRALLGCKVDDLIEPLIRFLPSTVMSRECTQYLISIDTQ